MKHNVKITIILLTMFVVTQFIGLYVVDHYSSVEVVDGIVMNVSSQDLPFGLETPEIEKETDFYKLFPSLILAFVIAISLLFFLTKFKAEIILKAWFFIVVLIALVISLIAILPTFNYVLIMALVVAIPLAFIKIYKKEFLIHNLTELFIYPGIAAVFVPILNFWTIIVLLILISIYDMWAVWHSGIMQKMAKYQIDKLNIFSGFFVPYVSGKMKAKIKKMKQTLKKSELKKKRIKVNVALLGGGDVIFPIITAGVLLKTGKVLLPWTNIQIFQGGFISALFVIFGATLGLSYLFFFSEKKKFYPAMPFITAGIFLGIVLSYFIF